MAKDCNTLTNYTASFLSADRSTKNLSKKLKLLFRQVFAIMDVDVDNLQWRKRHERENPQIDSEFVRRFFVLF